jgi:hypothetical protein
MNATVRAWSTLCPPAQIFPIVMSAVILFNLYRGTFRYALSHTIATLIGTTFLWILCAANLEFAAYALLLLPVIFFVFLLALIFYDQSLVDVRRAYECDAQPSCESTPSCETNCCA